MLAEQQTVARNPLLVLPSSEVNLTVMVVAVTGAGMEEPENVWVVDPSVVVTTVALGGGAIMDLHPVRAVRQFKCCKCECGRFPGC